MDDVLAYLETNSDAHVEQLKDLLRIPSVSADSQFRDDVLKAADFVKDSLIAAGLETELHETAGYPILTGRWQHKPDAPTAVIYGHYDVQPADPLELWDSPPFEPEVRDGKIYARGATDDKGQMFTHIKSVEAWLKTKGELPVNVIFVIEGEEEVGSNNLDKFLEEHKESLKCDIAVISDTSMYGPGIPAITYGLRGILACEVFVKGPNRDLHSGVFGGSVKNPANGLVEMLSKLHDENGRVQIPGFYDSVIELTELEREAFAELPFDEQAYCDDLGIPESFGEAGFSTTERRWARPTCDINGMVSGYTGQGPKTIVPSKASAKITCRLVPDQNAHQLTENLKTFLEQHLPPGLTMEFKTYHGCEAIVFDTTSDHFQAAIKAIGTAFNAQPVMIREGGSIPVVATFKKILGVGTLLLGWGLNTDNLHSPNEHFSLENFHNGILASAHLWHELGQI